MSRFSVLIVMLTLMAPAVADWRVETQKNAMTDKVTRFARVENNEAVFYLWKDKDGDYEWKGGFILKSAWHTIGYEPDEIMVRVDKNESVKIDTFGWEPDRVFFRIENNLIDQFSEGKFLRVQYPASRATRAVTAFTLRGFHKAIKIVSSVQ